MIGVRRLLVLDRGIVSISNRGGIPANEPRSDSYQDTFCLLKEERLSLDQMRVW